MLRVNEVFPTIQGEGYFTGTPAWFVRLQGCPVGCGWCDTKHTWETRADRQREWPLILSKSAEPADTYAELGTVAPLLDLLQGRPNVHHVVLTGGEPCLYDLNDLTEQLVVEGYVTQIETSCTYEVRAARDCWVTASPKYNMQGGRTVLGTALARADEVKFPVGKSSDVQLLLDEVLPQLRVGVPVYLQPLSQSAKATALCVNAALEHGLRLSVQTHKYVGIR